MELTTPRSADPVELHRWIMDFVQRFMAENTDRSGDDSGGGGSGTGRMVSGAATWWPLNVPPAGWVGLEGQVMDKSSYPILYSIYGDLFNTGGETAANFRLPNSTGRFAKSGATGVGGGSSTTIALANLPNISLVVTDPGHTHVFTGTSHNHTTNDPGHTHVIPGTAWASVVGSVDTAVAVGQTITTVTSGPITANSATTGVTNNATTAGGTNASASTGISVQLNGGGDALDIDPPWFGGMWIVRAE